MSEVRRKFDPEFREGAVQIVVETGRPVAEVARELGINEGTLWNWVRQYRVAQVEPGKVTETERVELERLRREVHELRMQRDVLKRSVVLWVDEAMGRRT